MSAPETSVQDPAGSDAHGDRGSAPPTRALDARRVAPERVRALVRLEQGLRGRVGRRPRLYATLIVAAVFVSAVLVGTVLGRAVAVAAGRDDLRAAAGGLGTDLVGAACVAGLLWRLGWWREVGFAGPSTWRSLRLLAVPAALALVLVVGGIVSLDLSNPARLALSLPQPFLTGFWEEGLTRGLLLSLLLAAALRGGRGPVSAVVISAAVFGLLHLVGVAGGTELGTALGQVVLATLFGIGFGALLLRTNALWLLAGLHALINLGPTVRGGNDGVEAFQAIYALSSLLLAVYGLFLLRRVKTDDQAAGVQHE